MIRYRTRVMNRSGALRGSRLTLLAALIAVSLAAPGRAAGGISETRTLSGFDRIRLQGAFTTEIVAGEHRTSVVVSGNRGVADRVTTEVEGGTLVVGMRPGTISSGTGPRIFIALPVLRGVMNEGAGSTKIAGLTGGDVDIENAGVGSIVASGRAARAKISLQGTGRIDTTGVDARDVTVRNDGVGAVHVRASNSLSMNVNGVGEIRYAGNPPHVQSHVEGVGTIGRL